MDSHSPCRAVPKESHLAKASSILVHGLEMTLHWLLTLSVRNSGIAGFESRPKVERPRYRSVHTTRESTQFILTLTIGHGLWQGWDQTRPVPIEDTRYEVAHSHFGIPRLPTLRIRLWKRPLRLLSR